MTRQEEQVRKAMLHYLDGSIHPEELEMLNRVVETDPQARREMAELMLQDALLSKLSEESEFFELDEPRTVPPAAVSCRTSRIMKITRRAPLADAPAPAAKPPYRRALIAAAAVLFAASLAMAVNWMQPSVPDSEPVTTVMPIVPVAPAATPLPAETPAAESPAKAVANGPQEAKPAPVKAKTPAAKPKTPTARKDAPETKPSTAPVPDGFLNLPSSNKLPPPSPSKPAPKLPPKPPPQKQPSK